MGRLSIQYSNVEAVQGLSCIPHTILAGVVLYIEFNTSRFLERSDTYGDPSRIRVYIPDLALKGRLSSILVI